MLCAEQSDNLTFIPGNGDGTFGAAATALGLNPSLDREIELADADGDNQMDVMYAIQQDSAVYALKSMGNGTFNVLDTLADIPDKIHMTSQWATLTEIPRRHRHRLFALLDHGFLLSR
ncbi:MAG: hypothetical protein H6603_06495 [Flavobacteriales bacterium]|nr:hypothetical protein [Flavobacteriales bacterium]